MTRRLTDHITNPANEAITIEVMDEPGQGGASHVYDMRLPGWGRHPSNDPAVVGEQTLCCLVKFQNGPIKEAGVNGVTQEALLAICIDRLRSFQGGKYACRENAIALTKMEEALMWLQKRTRAREVRGVEGTHTV